MSGDALHYGKPKTTRNQRRGFDKCRWDPCEHWPDGLEIQIYDDGRVKVGGWHTSVEVTDVSNYTGGASRPSGHVVARFHPEPGQDHDKGDDQR